MTAAPDAAALCSARWASSPQHEPTMARFSPAHAHLAFNSSEIGVIADGPDSQTLLDWYDNYGCVTNAAC